MSQYHCPYCPFHWYFATITILHVISFHPQREIPEVHKLHMSNLPKGGADETY